MDREKRLERERCLAAVSAEPELLGDMPDEMWHAISSDRDAATEALRIIVRQTKEGIRNRIIEQGEGANFMGRETVMRQWDKQRRAIANGDKSSAPRDWFESVLDALDAENQLLKELLRYAAPSVDHSTCLEPPYAECKRCEIEKATQT